MKNYLAGYYYDPHEDKEHKYYTDDYKNFYDENDKLLKNDILNQWSIWINSPWSLTCEQYEIKYNCKNYSDIPEGEPEWVCSYYVIGYDGITTMIRQYGNTPEESLEKTKAFFQYLQKSYNIEDEKV